MNTGLAPASLLSGGARQTTIVGVPLQPGERVIYYYRPDIAAKKRFLWVIGLALLIFIVGILFIVAALTLTKKPGTWIVTNMRVMGLSGDGELFSMPLDQIVDVEPVREDMQHVDVLNALVIGIELSLAVKKSKMDRAYWTRSAAIRLHNRDGTAVRLSAPDGIALTLGPSSHGVSSNPMRCRWPPPSAQIPDPSGEKWPRFSEPVG